MVKAERIPTRIKERPDRANLSGQIFESALSKINIEFFSTGKKTGGKLAGSIFTPLKEWGLRENVWGSRVPLYHSY